MPPRPDTTVYDRLREHALAQHPSGLDRHAVAAVLMDWHVPTGSATALATATGETSIYLSRGGGFLNGGHRFPEIRTAAQNAVALATTLLPQFAPAPSHHLPPAGQVFFFALTGSGLLRAAASQADLQTGASPLAPLAAAMQAVLSAYRASYQ